MIKQGDSSHRQKISSCSSVKCELVFVLTQENTNSSGFHFKANKKNIGFFNKTVIGIFKIAFRLRDRYIFMWESLEILHVFIALFLKHVFWKKRSFSSFLVESTSTEKLTFPYKTALSITSFKTNSMKSAKWTYHKE